MMMVDESIVVEWGTGVNTANGCDDYEKKKPNRWFRFLNLMCFGFCFYSYSSTLMTFSPLTSHYYYLLRKTKHTFTFVCVK